MTQYSYKPCDCGSGVTWRPVEDARGIFVAYVCSKCEKEKLGGYRKEIFYDPSYSTIEMIEDED